MPQFRLTQKFARDCKIKVLSEPSIVLDPLDDWFIDVFYAHRKKIAIITHAKSIFTFFVPYSECGGASGVMKNIEVLLKQKMNELNLGRYIEQVNILFRQPFSVCKTVDKKILGHMTDFKNCAGIDLEYFPKFRSQVDWLEVTDRINTTPLSFGSDKCTFPKKLFMEILSKHVLHS